MRRFVFKLTIFSLVFEAMNMLRLPVLIASLGMIGVVVVCSHYLLDSPPDSP